MSELLSPIGRTRVMGVINVTPDSFSDGGRWMDPETAIRHGFDMAAAGADIIDVGGESTRPGAIRIEPDEELRRVIPVIRALAAEGIAVSVDTMRADVAAQAIEAGALLINDVSGGRADNRMLAVAVESNVPIVLMHWRGHSATMQNLAVYDDVVAEVVAELTTQIDAAVAAGVPAGNIVLDPGLGFSKTGEQNWTVLASLAEFTALGYPLLVAASRKRFLGEFLAGPDGALRPTDEREAATVAVSTVSALAGAWAVRVHEPRATADAVGVVARIAAESVVEVVETTSAPTEEDR
jgi:dihydropteroate synthase